LLFSSVFVLISENPVHSVLFLILTFCNAAATSLSLNVEFLGLIFIIVYVGAMLVLFLFVVFILFLKILQSIAFSLTILGLSQTRTFRYVRR